ncbi:hypothetical protein SDC9_161337 [bioreactor metagenome]|uniref:Uncharacterized protein n=1 Tax=bioreactor metagenome TaxID=1076179 RepID=A0A645FHZ4_9ZZZZ
MQALITEVCGELIFHAAQRKARVLDSVCHAPDGCAEEHEVLLVVFDCIIAQHNIDEFAFAVWHKHALPGSTIVENAGACAVFVGDGIAKHRLAGGQVPEFGNSNAHADKPPVTHALFTRLFSRRKHVFSIIIHARVRKKTREDLFEKSLVWNAFFQQGLNKTSV